MKKTQLSEEQIQAMITEYTTQPTNIIKIASEYHMDPRRLRKIFDERNVPKKIRGAKEYDFTKVDEMHKAGKSVREIMEVTGISRYAITKRIKEPPVLGEKKPLVKKRIVLNVGDKLTRVYKEDGRGTFERDGVVHHLVIESIHNGLITCRHDNGTVETFSRYDLWNLFSKGQMHKEEDR